MSVKHIGFLGTGTIAVHHARVAQALGCRIVAGCTRRPDSPNWERFRETGPDVRRCDTVDEVLHDPDVEGIIVCLSWQEIPRKLGQLLACEKPMLIEKPIAWTEAEIPRGDHANKMIGYNRRFYESVDKLKQRLDEGGLKSVEVTISEDVQRHIQRKGPTIAPRILEFAASHTLDLVLYLLGPLTPRCLWSRPEADSDFTAYHGICTTRADVPVYFAINDNDPSPAGIRLRFADHTTWVLAPLETLSVYRGTEVIEPTAGDQIRKYVPRKISETRVDSSHKPGFLRQMQAFVTRDYQQAATIAESRRLLEFIKEIRHGGSVSGSPQTARATPLVAYSTREGSAEQPDFHRTQHHRVV